MIPPWAAVALRELGVAEVPGRVDNPRILAYHAATLLHADADEVPWCSAFVNWVLREAGLDSTHSAMARSWMGYGRALDTPYPWAIAVLRRGRNTALGHVGFLLASTPAEVYLLGGNQGDRVSIVPYPHGDLLTMRWPIGVPFPTDGSVR